MERLFKFQERRTNVRTEIVAGFATFMTMAYIIFVNPGILFGGTDMMNAGIVATCLAAGIMTIFMGLYTNFPLAMAAGMGLNAVVAYGMVAGAKLPLATAMGVIVMEGAIITILVLTKVREMLMDAIPMNLKRGIGVGIGLFIAFIGLVDSKMVVQGQGTPLALGDWTSPGVVLTLFGLVITVVLLVRRVKGAFLIGILGTTVIGLIMTWIGYPVIAKEAMQSAAHIVAWPTASSFATIGKVNVWAVLVNPALWGFVLATLMSDFFDTMGTVVSIGEQAGLTNKEGKVPHLNRILLVDSIGAMLGGLFGISSNTSYIESAAGVGEGGRTGLTSVVVGILFLLAIFFTPIIGLVPTQATAPALILVGFLMAQTAAEIDFSDWETAIPAFLTFLTIPLTYSIARGIGVGFVALTLIKLVKGKFKDLSWLMIIVSLFFLVDMLNLWSRIFGN
ncbi:MAG: NCS2 family permease [Mycobacterium leprae]